MRIFSIAAAAITALLATPSFSQTPDIFSANTIRTVNSADQSVLLWRFNADGTYSATDALGHTSKGTYAPTTTKFCRTPDGGKPVCQPLAPPNLQVGDSWTFQDDQGAKFTATIIAGRS